jgi:hypothetical protein
MAGAAASREGAAVGPCIFSYVLSVPDSFSDADLPHLSCFPAVAFEAYFRQFASKPCLFEDLRPFLSTSPAEAEPLVKFLKSGLEEEMVRRASSRSRAFRLLIGSACSNRDLWTTFAREQTP